MEAGVVSDSSFYICFVNDIERKDWLHRFVRMYSFYLGKRVLNEISDILSEDEGFFSMVTRIDIDYYELVKPYFGRSIKHMDDGEYEIIGIAYYIETKNHLKYLILDETRARKFVKRHFPSIAEKMVGTVGFVRDCCCKDRKIDPIQAIEILNSIKKAVEAGKGNRPCSMDPKSYKEILIPTIEKIKRGLK